MSEADSIPSSVEGHSHRWSVGRFVGLLRQRLGLGAISFVAATLAVAVSNLGFHIVGSRLMGPQLYGGFGALLNLTLFLSVPMGAVQAAVTQGMAARRTSGAGERPSLRHHSKDILTLAMGGMGSILLVAPLLNDYLHLNSRAPATLLALWILPATGSSFLQGVLAGEMRFGPLALAMVIGTGIGRLAFGAMLLSLGFGLAGAMAATLLGQTLTLVILWRAAISGWRTRRVGPPLRTEGRTGWLSLGAMGGLAVLGGVDVVEARHFLPSVAAGHYAAAANAGRIAVFLPAALAVLAFPRLAGENGTGKQSNQALRDFGVAVAAVGAICAVLLWMVPQLAVTTIFGSSYISAASVVAPLAWAAAAYGLSMLATYYFLARKSWLALASWPSTAVLLLLIFLLHSSASEIASAVLLAQLLTCAFLWVMAADSIVRDAAISRNDDLRWTDFWHSQPNLDLTLVVPFFNPGPNLTDHLTSVAKTLADTGITFEVIAVSDGSTDGSEPDPIRLPESVRCMRLPFNQGKGAALYMGLAEGRGRYLGFIDADGDVPASVLETFVESMLLDEPDLLIGSKRHPDSRLTYPWLRRLCSVLYQALCRGLFRLEVKDTQTGIKLIRREVLASALPRMLEKRFAFDLELLVVARQLGYQTVRELPVVIDRQFSSTVGPRAVINLLTDTLAIFYRLRILHFYGQRVSRLPVGPLCDPALTRVCMVSPYASSTDPKAGGVGTYVRELLRHVGPRTEVEVMAQRGATLCDGDRVSITPTWSSRWSSLRRLSAEVTSRRPDVLHVQHEFRIFGGPLRTTLTVHRLAHAVPLRTRMVITLHSVLAPDEVTVPLLRSMGIRAPRWLVRSLLSAAMLSLRRSSRQFIVHHEYFKDVLCEHFGFEPATITVVPHGRHDVEVEGLRRSPAARNVLAFGFLTPYKAPEVILSLAESGLCGPDTHFSLVVGRNPRDRSGGYSRRYQALEERAHRMDHVSWSGFVPEEELEWVFGEADVLVLPYTQCVSVSGVAALAARFGVPIAYSSALRPLFGDGPGEFDLDVESLAAAVDRVTADTGSNVDQDIYVPWGTAAQLAERVWSENPPAAIGSKV